MAKKIKIQKNFIDRFVDYVSPTRGAARHKARLTMAFAESYTGASKTRRVFADWLTSSGDADADTVNDLETLRERSRDLIRNNPIAGGAIATKITNIVGTGLRVKAQADFEFIGITEDQAQLFERDAERYFKIWASSPECDHYRRQTFAQMQELALRSTFENGDCFALLPAFERGGSLFERKVQLIEGDYVSTPSEKSGDENIIAGIEKDERGAPKAAYISDYHYGSFSNTVKDIKWRKVDFYDDQGNPRLLHIHKSLRINQTRGIPDLAPVIEPLKQLGRYTEAELMAAVISGMFTVFITTPDGDSDLAMNMPDVANQKKDDGYKLGNGAIVGLADGEEISTANPGRPNDKFDPFVLAIMRQIGVALELPYEMLIKHFTASYSASRAALLEAWRMFRTRRQWFAAQFCQPIYESVVTECVGKGWIAAPGFFSNPMIRAAYLQTVWTGDAPGQLDPLKEANAARARVDANFSTETRETMEITGADWEMDQRQRRREMDRHRADGTNQDLTQSLPTKDHDIEVDPDENDEDTEAD